jgi:hypothetical protein
VVVKHRLKLADKTVDQNHPKCYNMDMFSKKEMQMQEIEPMTRQEELHSIYWEMFKDAYGYRPRGIDTSAWTEQRFAAEFEVLGEMIDKQEVQRRIAEQEAAHEFEMRVQSILACGARDRAMALRWIHEAEGSNGDDEYLCYLVGLPYRYFVKETV